MKLYFGKFIGQDLCEIDLSYVRWLEEQPWVSAELRSECQHEIERRTGNITSLGRAVQPAPSRKVSLVAPK